MTGLVLDIIETYFIFSLSQSPSQLSISRFFVSKTNISPLTSHLQMPRYCLKSSGFIPQTKYLTRLSHRHSLLRLDCTVDKYTALENFRNIKSLLLQYSNLLRPYYGRQLSEVSDLNLNCKCCCEPPLCFRE